MEAPARDHPVQSPPELRWLAWQALCCSDVDEKRRLTTALWAQAESVPLDPDWERSPETMQALSGNFPPPGRPARPRLIDPGQVPQRSPFTPDGRAALIHAICHIEFNAINLALDAVWRFPHMPRDFYLDWLRVAAEEADHFGMLHALLQTLPNPAGSAPWRYGDFDAHDGLWAMCEKTAHDITARMALVPRTLEARGLDATPLIQAKLRKVNTPDSLQAIELLNIILRDEVGHVAIGNRWYRWLCEQSGLDPISHYRHLARQYDAPRLKPPFNESARRAAGFSQLELDYLFSA